jgi:hypothetical protein
MLGDDTLFHHAAVEEVLPGPGGRVDTAARGVLFRDRGDEVIGTEQVLVVDVIKI